MLLVWTQISLAFVFRLLGSANYTPEHFTATFILGMPFDIAFVAISRSVRCCSYINATDSSITYFVFPLSRISDRSVLVYPIKINTTNIR